MANVCIKNTDTESKNIKSKDIESENIKKREIKKISSIGLDFVSTNLGIASFRNIDDKNIDVKSTATEDASIENTGFSDIDTSNVYTLEQYCSDNDGKDYIRMEWLGAMNAPYTLGTLGVGSHRRVWWRCSEGHMWECAVKDRVKKDSRCPYCTNRRVLKGFNDLSSVNPEVAKEWNYKRNTGLTPEQVTAGSERTVWWRCWLGHEWKSTVENRAMKGNGCPYCSGRKAWPGYNDLATLYPDLTKEWHRTLNKGLNPKRLRPGSAKKAWWQCREGHVWEARIYSRTSKKRPGCPFCAGNVSREKAAEWMRIDPKRGRNIVLKV